MASLDAWQADGFSAIAKPYLRRLTSEAGVHSTIAVNGDLLLQRKGKGEPERQSLVMALQQPSWLGPVSGVPRQ
jgi:hypothetical protein